MEEGERDLCAAEGKVEALAASMERFHSMFAHLVEKLVDLVTHGRALKPLLPYLNKEAKAVKDKEKESKAFEDTVSRIAGEGNGIVTTVNAAGKEKVPTSWEQGFVSWASRRRDQGILGLAGMRKRRSRKVV